MLSVVFEGRTYAGYTLGALRREGVPDAAIAAALRKNATAEMLKAVDAYRQRLSGSEAGTVKPGPERIGIWAAKARLAREHIGDPDAMPEPFKTHMTREGAAKGRSLADQLGRIVFKANTFEALGMMIDAMEAEAHFGLSAVTDEAGLAGGFDAFLAQAAQNANEAFAEALAALAA